MRLQKNTSLALYSVLEFARTPERHIAAAEIAEKYNISAHHLAKVLAELARSGILDSVRGAGGGYRFTGNAKRLTLSGVDFRSLRTIKADLSLNPTLAADSTFVIRNLTNCDAIQPRLEMLNVLKTSL